MTQKIITEDCLQQPPKAIEIFHEVTDNTIIFIPTVSYIAKANLNSSGNNKTWEYVIYLSGGGFIKSKGFKGSEAEQKVNLDRECLIAKLQSHYNRI